MIRFCDISVSATDGNTVIEGETLIWGTDIFENGRRIFKKYYGISSNEVCLVPVYDQDNTLVCFAYEDELANRQMRELRELQEPYKSDKLIRFQEVYSNINVVKISGCNELAFAAREYLTNCGIQVITSGKYWNYLLQETDQDNNTYSDYEVMEIYAEGTWEKKKNLRMELIRTVGVCFEFIDKIYMNNVKAGQICDTNKCITDLPSYLKNRKVVVISYKKQGLELYAYLRLHGIEVVAFIDRTYKQGPSVLGIPVWSENQVVNAEDVVILNPNEKNSAYGHIHVDSMDYYGFIRNEKYICVQDYIKIEGNFFEQYAKDKPIVFWGNPYFCKYLMSGYEQDFGKKDCYYLNVFDENLEAIQDIRTIEKQDLPENSIILFVSITSGTWIYPFAQEKSRYLDELDTVYWEENCDYYCNEGSLLNFNLNKRVDGGRNINYLIGQIPGGAGTFLLRGIIDGHPHILTLPNHDIVNENLLRIGMMLSQVKKEHMYEVFCKLLRDFNNNAAFRVQNQYFSEEFETYFEEELDRYDDAFGPVSIMNAIVVAYNRVNGKNVANDQKYYIYWEQHGGWRDNCDLHKKNIEGSCDAAIVNMFRNEIIRSGGTVKRDLTVEVSKELGCDTEATTDVFGFAQSGEAFIEKEDFKSNIVLSFENLKLNPKEEMKKFCRSSGLEWNDCFLEIQEGFVFPGYKNGFDLKPVYNAYEEYFNGLDRMKLELMHSYTQKIHGYPYVEMKGYSWFELQELFYKDFKFEKLCTYDSNKKLQKKKEVMRLMWERLERNRYIEEVGNKTVN